MALLARCFPWYAKKMSREGKGQSFDAAEEDDAFDEEDTLDRLLAVADGKPSFENLSWRLLRLLIQGTTFSRREFGPGDKLSIGDDLAMMYVESGGFVSLEDEPLAAGKARGAAAGKARDTAAGKARDAVAPKPRRLRAGETRFIQSPSTPAWLCEVCKRASGSDATLPLLNWTRSIKYEATKDSVVRLFFKKPAPAGRARRESSAASVRDPLCGWERLLDHSLVARRALLGPKEKPTTGGSGREPTAAATAPGREGGLGRSEPTLPLSTTEPRGEVVLLSSLDLVEYLPALTELLAQKMARELVEEDPPIEVILVRFDPAAAPAVAPTEAGKEKENEKKQVAPPVDLTSLALDSPEWARCTNSITVGSGVEVKVITAYSPTDFVATVGGCRARGWPRRREHGAPDAYVFVDPYDRASELAAVQVTMRTARGRVVSEEAGRTGGGLPGTSLSRGEFEKLLEPVDSVVNVARNFRVDRPESDVRDKLQFHAVVLDSRTARFESGGTRDRRQRRNADDPVRSPIDPPDRGFQATPTTRLHLNLLRLKKAWEQSPKLDHVCAVLDEPNLPAAGDRRGYWSAESFFDRWVRDLRFRRVGVALGGGGATGFAHVAMLRALREEGIPIDLVSGTSFGALAGAYYCALGLDGLETLMEQALLYTGVASLTMLTSLFFEHLVNLSIDFRPMWELPIPFYAVATDIESGKAAVFPGPAAGNPSVGFAVRASGSLPGFFAPAIAGDARYLDGGAVSLVPVKALINAGADVVIGSNAFPFRRGGNPYSPTPLRGFLPPPFGRLAARLIAEFNPGNRMVDAARSMSLSLTDAMVKETKLASAIYEHKRTDVKYWEFHRAALVFRAALQDLPTSGALPAAVSAYRLINTPAV